MNETPQLLTTRETSLILGLHPKTVQSLAKAFEEPRAYVNVRGLKCSRIGPRGHYRFQMKDIEAWMEGKWPARRGSASTK